MLQARSARRSTASDDRDLRGDVRLLGWELRRVLQSHGSLDLLGGLAKLRDLAQRRRHNDPHAGQEIADALAGWSLDQLHQLIRVLGCYLDLVNLAEDRHRMRVLRRREMTAHPAPRGESIGAAVEKLQEKGLSAERMQELLDALNVNPVFTAHPTEAKRATVRQAYSRMRQDLCELERRDLLPRDRDDLLARIRSDLACLWETDTVRPRRPTVLEEVVRNLFVAGTLWDVVPRLCRELRTALSRNYPGHVFSLPAFLRFGTWIGGDRDGNPYVTAEVTRRTLHMLRQEGVRRHLEASRQLESRLSISDRYHPISPALADAVRAARKRWLTVDMAVAACHPHEPYRHWLVTIRQRLEATLHWTLEALPGASSKDPPAAGEDHDLAYRSSDELIADVQLIAENLRASGHAPLADGPVQEWLDRIAALGFHTAALDIREESGRLQGAVHELMVQMRIGCDYQMLPEAEKQQVLLAEIDARAVQRMDRDTLSPTTRETLDLFRLLQQTAAAWGVRSLGVLIVSMTHQPSDVLTMLWLSRLGAIVAGVPHTPLPIVPLLETIADLNRADGLLRQLLEHKSYAAYLRSIDNNQTCMIGYSDSVKDGGYLSANWQLYDAQRRLAALADEFGIRVTFFHGRGGSLGRGGGPAARAVLSLPPDSVRGRLRVTEQGEVIAERYGDPEVAHRHLEQLTWATLLVSAEAGQEPNPAWVGLLRRAATLGYESYRRLVDDPGFPAYFHYATPIEVIETLPIGSRPSRRGDRSRLESLRAIPYTFAWTQSRLLLTGYFGLGSGLTAACEGNWAVLQEMYRDWPFFRALVDNADLALAKAELGLVRAYAGLVPDRTQAERILQPIEAEFCATRDAVLRITGRDALLGSTPWLQRSIDFRNPDVDLLNYAQIEMLRRRWALTPEQAQSPEMAELDELLRASVQAVSSGMRTTG